MKMHPKMRWGCVALVIVAVLVGGFVLTDSAPAPSYPELKASCDDALSKSPRSETLDAWMNANHISSRRRTEPLEDSFKDMLVSNGISNAAVNRAATCTYFEGLHVRGGFPYRHVAYGYFVFSADGSLIDYSIHDICYGM